MHGKFYFTIWRPCTVWYFPLNNLLLLNGERNNTLKYRYFPFSSPSYYCICILVLGGYSWASWSSWWQSWYLESPPMAMYWIFKKKMAVFKPCFFHGFEVFVFNHAFFLGNILSLYLDLKWPLNGLCRFAPSLICTAWGQRPGQISREKCNGCW